MHTSYKIVQNSWRNIFLCRFALVSLVFLRVVNDKSDKDSLVSIDDRDYLSPLFEERFVQESSTVAGEAINGSVERRSAAGNDS